MGGAMNTWIIETPRLALRRLTWEDRAAVAHMLQDLDVMYAWEHAFSEDEVDRWIENHLRQRHVDDHYGYMAVLLKETSALIGQCGITLQDAGRALVPEVGYLFAKEYWHHGYATEAAQAVRDYAFGVLHVPAVYSIIRDTNTPSIRVAERNGMKPVGTVMKIYRGIHMPHIIYKIKGTAK